MMLVSIYLGADMQTAKSHGALYFSRLPEPGDNLIIDGRHTRVSKAWHTPDANFAGPKYAVLAHAPDTQAAAQKATGH